MTRTEGGCACVLSGGGAYAAYEVGVLRALFTGASPATKYTRLNPAVLTGTSAGSFNAALFASAPADEATAALDYVERVWLGRIAERAESCVGNVIRVRGNLFGLLNPACQAPDSGFFRMLADDAVFLGEQWAARSANFFSTERPLRQRVIETVDLATFLSGDPLRRVLSDAVKADRIQQSRCRIHIAATNWRTGELRVFVNEDMDDARAVPVVLASSAIPGVFASVEIDGEPYVDGGVVMNTPLRPAIHAGADELHVIYMDPDVSQIPLPRLRNTVSTFHRTLVISFGLTVNRDIATAKAINRRLRVDERAAFTTALTGTPRAEKYRPLTIHRYHPTDDLGGTFRWLEFDAPHIHRLIERGYEDARAHDCEFSRCVFPDPGDEASDERPWEAA